jgi:uncharacterized protein (DUF58 family)
VPRAVEEYLKPEVVQQVARLDLRAQFIVRGFLQGLHASPYQGFSVEFSEHRKYVHGDDPKDIDWLVYAKTDKHYVKKYEAETNITGYLLVDASGSMAYTYRQELTKLDYAISLAAALCWMMVHQQDPCGLVVFDERVRTSLPARSRRSQIASVLSILSKVRPSGGTDVGRSLVQVAAMLRHRSLLMVFSDLLGDPGPIRDALLRLRHRGHDVILFHVLDEAEERFPFTGMVDFVDPEAPPTAGRAARIVVDADAVRPRYLERVGAFREDWRQWCRRAGIDHVTLDTSMQFDRALTSYLVSRRNRF